MQFPRHYPAFISLAGQQCLVVGFGPVGRRKLAALLECGPASTLVLDQRPPASFPPEYRELLQRESVRFACRPCEREDVRKSFVVCAASGDPNENLRIAAICREEKTLCNCASPAGAGNFIVPASARCGPLCAALSTGGQSPALAARWKRELEQWLAPKADFARLLGKLRPLVKAASHRQDEREAIFRSLADSGLEQAFLRGERGQCLAMLQKLLPAACHAELLNIFNGK